MTNPQLETSALPAVAQTPTDHRAALIAALVRRSVAPVDADALVSRLSESPAIHTRTRAAIAGLLESRPAA